MPSSVLPGRRDARIDFLRGLALLFIFVDHVPDSLLSLVTLHSYALADAAELFFFLSGYVAAMVYGGLAARSGMTQAVVKIWRRAWVLYAAQLLLLVFLVAEIALAAVATGSLDHFAHFRLAAFRDAPDAALLQALLLRYQPAYLDILPVYVLLLLAFPLVLAGLKRSPWAVLVPSAALWLAVQVIGLTLHRWPDGAGWFFNPLAWQFVFVLGAALGHPEADWNWQALDRPWVVRGALALCALAALAQLPEALRILFPHIVSLQPAGLDLDKSALAPLRLVSFLALAVVVRRYLPDGAALAAFRPARWAIGCGRHSLPVFCLGVLLAAGGHVLAEEADHSLLIQFLYSLAGLIVLLGYAGWREALRQGARWPRPGLRQPA